MTVDVEKLRAMNWGVQRAQCAYQMIEWRVPNTEIDAVVAMMKLAEENGYCFDRITPSGFARMNKSHAAWGRFRIMVNLHQKVKEPRWRVALVGPRVGDSEYVTEIIGFDDIAQAEQSLLRICETFPMEQPIPKKQRSKK